MVIVKLGKICFKVFLTLILFQDKRGPIPIIKIAGKIIGTTVKL